MNCSSEAAGRFAGARHVTPLSPAPDDRAFALPVRDLCITPTETARHSPDGERQSAYKMLQFSRTISTLMVRALREQRHSELIANTDQSI